MPRRVIAGTCTLLESGFEVVVDGGDNRESVFICRQPEKTVRCGWRVVRDLSFRRSCSLLVLTGSQSPTIAMYWLEFTQLIALLRANILTKSFIICLLALYTFTSKQSFKHSIEESFGAIFRV